MKKLVSLILAVAMVLCVLSFASAEETYRVAMITDSGDITDQSFNQTTYEACKAFCEENGLDFNYFKPTGDSDAERIAQVEAATRRGLQCHRDARLPVRCGDRRSASPCTPM